AARPGPAREAAAGPGPEQGARAKRAWSRSPRSISGGEVRERQLALEHGNCAKFPRPAAQGKLEQGVAPAGNLALLRRNCAKFPNCANFSSPERASAALSH